MRLARQAGLMGRGSACCATAAIHETEGAHRECGVAVGRVGLPGWMTVGGGGARELDGVQNAFQHYSEL